MTTRNKAKRLRTESARTRVFDVPDLVAQIVAFGTLADQARFFATCSAVAAHRKDCGEEIDQAADHQFRLEYPYAHAASDYFSKARATTRLECWPSPIKMAKGLILKWRKKLHSDACLTYTRRTRSAKATPCRPVKKMMLRVAFSAECMGLLFNIVVFFERGVVQILEVNYPREKLSLGGRNFYKHNLSAFEANAPFFSNCVLENNACYFTHVDDLPLSGFRGVKAFKAYLAEKKGICAFKFGMLLLPVGAPRSAVPDQCKIPRVDAEDVYWDGKHMLI